MPVSSPTSVINAAAAVTHRIGLGSTVLSTDDPIRVYQQHATADASHALALAHWLSRTGARPAGPGAAQRSAAG